MGLISGAADTEAIGEAAVRPSMRFVPVKSEEVQGAAMAFRVRELLIRQRTQAINAPRRHLAKFEKAVPQGVANAVRLIAIAKNAASVLTEEARATLLVLIETKNGLDDQIAKLNAEISWRAKEEGMARRLMAIPGIGPLIAMTLVALAPLLNRPVFPGWPRLSLHLDTSENGSICGFVSRRG